MKWWDASDARAAVVGDRCICLRDKTGEPGRVVFICHDDDGGVSFTDGCDRYYTVWMTPQEAKAALLEAVAWIDAVAGSETMGDPDKHDPS